MNKFGLPQRTVNEILAYFLKSPDIEKVMIFGSRAKGNYHNGSDIDFAVWTDKHDSIIDVTASLNNLPTPYKFDVVDYKNISHEGIKNSIDRDAVLFYQREDKNIKSDKNCAKPILSDREIEILNMMLKGDSIKTIGNSLFISSHTVKAHLTSIMKKFNVNSNSELLTVAANYSANK